jgi:hypothetical protein
MPRVGHDGEPGRRDRALEQQTWLQAGLVLVAVDHERRRVDTGELAGDVVQGRPGPLDPDDGAGHAFGGVLGQLPGELFPDMAVLAPQLDPVRPHGLLSADRRHAVSAEGGRHLLGLG